MKTKKHFCILLSVTLVLSFLFSGCEKSSFEKAKESNTIEALDQFLKDYPEGNHAAEIRSLREKLIYQHIRKENTVTSYNRYLKQFPQGIYKGEAKREVFWRQAEASSQVKGKRNHETYLIITGGGKNEKAAQIALEVYRAQNFPEIIPEQEYETTLVSDHMNGLNPGFHITVAGMCRNQMVANVLKELIGQKIPGTYLRKIRLAEKKLADLSCPLNSENALHAFAKTVNSENGWLAYLSQYPAGSHHLEAREKLEWINDLQKALDFQKNLESPLNYYYLWYRTLYHQWQKAYPKTVSTVIPMDGEVSRFIEQIQNGIGKSKQIDDCSVLMDYYATTRTLLFTLWNYKDNNGKSMNPILEISKNRHPDKVKRLFEMFKSTNYAVHWDSFLSPLMVNELLTTYERIVGTPDWETKFSQSKATILNSYALKLNQLGQVFYSNGFPKTTNKCLLATFRDTYDVCPESWMYSFWFRRYREKTFHITHSILKHLDEIWQNRLKNYPEIMRAIAIGNERDVGLLLSYGVDPDSSDGTTSALQIALRYRRYAAFKALLEKNAEWPHLLTDQEKQGLVVFMGVAVRMGHTLVIKKGLEHGIDPNLEMGYGGYWLMDGYRNTMLLEAASRPHVSVEMLDLLVKAGADVNKQGYIDHTFDYLEVPEASVLLAAVVSGDKSKVNFFLDLGIATESTDGKRVVPLSMAVKRKDFDMVKLLLQRGASIDARNRLGDTALMKAAENCFTSAVELLIQKGADIEAKDQFGETALMKAADRLSNGSWEGDRCIRFLIQKGADIEVKDNRGETALMKAARRDNIEAIKALNQVNANLEVRNELRETALMKAARKCGISSVRFFVQKGADIEAKDYHGETALMKAVESYDLKDQCAKFLIQKGADIEAKDHDGETALMKATRRGYTGIIKALIQTNPNLEARNKKGETALITAAEEHSTSAVRLLIQKGADIEAKNHDGETALIKAVDRSYYADPCVRLLIQKGADIEAKDHDGETALMKAARFGNIRIIKALIQADANLEAKNKKGKTAAKIAAEKDKKKALAILIENGAKRY